MTESKKNTIAIWSLVGLLVLMLTVGAIVTALDPSEYKHLAGNCNTGVVVYLGKGELYAPVFTILGGDRQHKTLLVELQDGSQSVESREKLVSDERFFVRKDDPALKDPRWMYTD